jgi:oligopeptidase A
MSESHPPNPLLRSSYRIPFDEIRPDHVVPGVAELLSEAEAEIDRIGSVTSAPRWDNTLEPLGKALRRVDEGTKPIQHLLAVAESRELREAWSEVLPRISAFWTRLFLHEGLWARLQAFEATNEADALTGVARRHLEKTMRDFRRSGADLAPDERARLEEIDVEMAQLEQKFSENVLDATADWSLHVEEEEELEGIPVDFVARFAKHARERDLEGWVIHLDAPSVHAILKHARTRALRHTVHEAFLSRGSEEPWDNRPLIPEILKLRQEKATLLGYPDFPDFRLEEQMTGGGEAARSFVRGMIDRTRPYWERDFEVVRTAGLERGLEPVRPWDVSYLVEQLRRERFDLDEEELRAYFPLDRVLEGLFELAGRIFGLSVEETPIEEVWHPEVRFFEVRDDDGSLLGHFYADLFPRPEKRQGAWMNAFIHGTPDAEGRMSPHLGLICANFPPPSESGTPSLLTHRDVETLFHEFGHLLHHCTSRVPIPERGGIHVAWDWVEVPSQLMENWTWEREALDVLSGHWESGETLPDELYRNMVRARRFMGGWNQMRQLSFSTLDLALHTDFDPAADGDPVEWVDRLLEPLSPDPTFAKAHPLPAFLHLFSGGYAASYYSYLWSEVMEADLFTRFLERGIFDSTTGRRYLETILSAGDMDDPETLFRAFMDRDPDPEALIRRNLGDVEAA